MMKNTLIFGFIGTIAVFFGSIGLDNLAFYFQPHSMVIVIGGSITLLLFSTPNGVLKNLWTHHKSLLKTQPTFLSYKDEISQLSQSKALKQKSENPLINYATELWEQGLNEDLFIVLLSQKKNELVSEHSDSVQTMKNMAKYPPALGMAGTVMGMIALFSSLDSNQGNIGKDLALAMTATFFGLILANAIFSPLADRLQVNQVHNQRLYRSLYEILLLINQDEPGSLIMDEVDHRAA